MIQEEQKIVDFSTQVNFCVHNERPFALYKKPYESSMHFVSGTLDVLNANDVDFDVLPPGFLISPYDGKSVYFIKKEEIPFEVETEPSDEGFSLEFDHTFIDKQEFLKAIENAIETIKSTDLQKVVLSRRQKIGKLKAKNFYAGFKKTTELYPSAFVSLVYINGQFWLGASPEILVSEDKVGIFKTVALAGTQSATDLDGRDISPMDALWTSKEIEEQAMVSRYIINCLKKIRVREYEELGPKTIKAGNLLHLKTTYSIDSEQINFRNLSSVMLSLLHPTSAVCGMPKYLAQETISKLETYDRELYSGYIGPVNIDNESNLYVNLRTLKIEKDEVYLYAGGGITEDSVPEKEFNETVLKMQTILKAFS